MKKNPGLSRDDKRLFFAKLNQAGAITVLDFLNTTQASQLCEKLMREVLDIPYLKEGSSFKLFDIVTGKAYEHELKIVQGKVVNPQKPWPLNQVKTKPKDLLGKKEGGKVEISDKEYVIKEIQ